jgi:predicted ferric reductase
MRASGFVAFGLLTFTLALGVANLARWERGRWTRAVAALVHRNASLLAVVFLAIHIATAVSDKYVSIPLLAAVIPGLSGYDPLWVGTGALSLDIMAALVVTSLVRDRLSRRSWKAVHWFAYLAWPTALVHSVGAGTGNGVDTGHVWSTAIYLSAGFVVILALALRLVVRAGVVRRAPAHPGLGTARRPAPVLPAGRTAAAEQDAAVPQTARRLPSPTSARSFS